MDQEYVIVMETLKNIYFVDDYDIFNFLLSSKNYITYHHLIHQEDLKLLGFSTKPTIQNGIALTRYSHGYLHFIEILAPDIFHHINKILFLITKERRLPTLEERNLLQIFLEAFEYRMLGYASIPSRFLRRERYLKS